MFLANVISHRLGALLNNVGDLGPNPTQQQFNQVLQRSRKQGTLNAEAAKSGIPTQIAFRTVVSPEAKNQ